MLLMLCNLVKPIIYYLKRRQVPSNSPRGHCAVTQHWIPTTWQIVWLQNYTTEMLNWNLYSGQLFTVWLASFCSVVKVLLCYVLFWQCRCPSPFLVNFSSPSWIVSSCRLLRSSGVLCSHLLGWRVTQTLLFVHIYFISSTTIFHFTVCNYG